MDGSDFEQKSTLPKTEPGQCLERCASRILEAFQTVGRELYSNLSFVAVPVTELRGCTSRVGQFRAGVLSEISSQS